METKIVRASSDPQSGKDTNSLSEHHDTEKLNQEQELNEPVNVDETCVEKKVHQFYFIKYWPHEDQTLKSRIQEAEKLYKNINRKAWSVADTFDQRLLDQRNLVLQVYDLCSRYESIRNTLDWIAKKLDHLQLPLGKLDHSKNSSRERTYFTIDKYSEVLIQRMNKSRGRGKRCSYGPYYIYSVSSIGSDHAQLEFPTLHSHRTKCFATENEVFKVINDSQKTGAFYPLSSVKELRYFFRWLYDQMQHQTNNKAKNNQIVKEIELLEKEAEKATTKATCDGKIGGPSHSRKSMQDQVRLINKIAEVLRMECLKIKAKLEHLKRDLKVAENDISHLKVQFNDIKQRRIEVNQCILNLRKQQDEEKGRYCRYNAVLSKARKLARKKDVKALKELYLREVDMFMSRWNKSKAFRYNYERSILPSLDKRQLNRNGCTAEEPLILKDTSLQHVTNRH